jgi:hypothetical protein
LELVRRWLDGEDMTADDLRAAAAYAASAYAAAASAAYAATAASAASAAAAAASAAATAPAASASAYAAAYAYAYAGEGALIDWLDYVLDCHEKVAAEEGQWDEMAARAVEVDTLLGDEAASDA